MAKSHTPPPPHFHQNAKTHKKVRHPEKVRSAAMRRNTASSPLGKTEDPRKETQLPSNAVVDMFGRLFGRILATLFEGSFQSLGTSEAAGKQLGDVVSEFFHQFHDRPSSPIHEQDSPMTHKGDETPSEICEGAREFLELKQRLLTAGESGQPNRERSIDLISRSTPFFEREGTFEYDILPFPGRDVFEGLISFLTKTKNGNPHDKGIIFAEGTPYDGQACHQPRNALDLETDSYFHSQNAENQWMSVDFKEMRVAVTHYILRSNGNGTGGPHLRSWVVEGSENKVDWVELDCRKDDGGLNGANKVCSFEVQSVVESRFIRIRSTGPNWHGSNYVYFNAFEVYGSLRIPGRVKTT
jgi:hypothetical protein